MVRLENIYFSFKNREVLKGISLAVPQKEIFGLLGPNGSGKTTLFRILATVLRPASGTAEVFSEIRESKIREKIGVVFQSPSLDVKLTVKENIRHQGHLYGLSGQALEFRMGELISRLGLSERIHERAEKLSGGLKRRVELAKALLHQPSVLILDEPSTGLDPGARIDFWTYLKKLRDENGMTILVTTHLMDEAEHCDRLAILNHGKILKTGTPGELKQKIRGDVVIIKTPHPEKLAAAVKEKFGAESVYLNHALQVEHEKGAEFIAQVAGAFAGDIESIMCRKPTLEDVFLNETGHRFWEENEEMAAARV